MANLYVRNDGSNTSPYDTWAKAATTLATAMGACAAGDNIFVGDGHAESTAGAVNINGPASSLTNPVKVLCVNDTGNPEPPTALATGAVVEVTGANDLQICQSGEQGIIIHGIEFKGATNASAQVTIGQSSAQYWYVETSSCFFNNRGGSASAGAQATVIGTGATTHRGTRYISTNDTFALPNNNGLQYGIILSNGYIKLINPTVAYSGAGKPTSIFFVNGQTTSGVIEIIGADLTAHDKSSGALFDVGNSGLSKILLKDSKYNSAATPVTGSYAGPGIEITIRNCDNGDTINTFEFRNWLGTVVESASIYSGASFSGAGVGWQIVTSSGCSETQPFRVPLLSRWNSSTSSQDFTVNFVHDNATGLNDREIWVDVYIPASSSNPQYSRYSDRNTAPFIGSGSTQSSSSLTWTGTGGFSNENKQKCHITQAAAEVGLVEAELAVGVASKTLYVDPVLYLNDTVGAATRFMDYGAIQEISTGGGGGGGAAQLVNTSGLVA